MGWYGGRKGKESKSLLMDDMKWMDGIGITGIEMKEHGVRMHELECKALGWDWIGVA